MRQATLTDVLLTEELSRRPCGRSQNTDAVARFTAVIGEVGRSPLDVLRCTAAEALLLCQAHSAGVTMVEGGHEAAHQTLRHQAVVGPWAPATGTTVPRAFSPQGLTIDRHATQLFHAPERYYPHLREAHPPASEMLLVPFEPSAGRPGVVWAVLHDLRRQFDQDDTRLLHALTCCGSVAFGVARSVHGAPGHTPASSQLIETPGRRLSAREAQVCLLVAQGHTNKAIGALLGVSEKSVATYRARVADKLNVRTRADYVAFALARGWLHTAAARGPVSQDS